MNVLLEVCIDSIDSAKAAKDGGADRLEVCSALAVGGTTPSFGLVEQCVADLEMPVMMMIRPHDGHFVYEAEDIDTMLTNIEVARSIGVQGIVFGALTAQRTLDVSTCKKIIEAADDLEVTFHRAFDVVVDPLATLAELETLGVDRILTSGQMPSALAGADLLQQLVQHTKKISILAGAGVNDENALELVERTGVSEVHASASIQPGNQQSNGNPDHTVAFGDGRRVTSADKVRAIVDALASKVP